MLYNKYNVDNKEEVKVKESDSTSKAMDLINSHLAQINAMLEETQDETPLKKHDDLTMENLAMLDAQPAGLVEAFEGLDVASGKHTKVVASKTEGVQTYAD